MSTWFDYYILAMMLVLRQDATNNFARVMYVDLLPAVIQTGLDYQYSSFVMTIPVFGFSVKSPITVIGKDLFCPEVSNITTKIIREGFKLISGLFEDL